MLSAFFLLLSILLSVLNPVGRKPAGMPPSTRDFSTAKARLLKSYRALPMSFELNQGQADRTVRFQARGQGYAILLKPSEALLALQPPSQNTRVPEKRGELPRPSSRVLKMRIEGANPSAPATGLHRLPGISNYFIGNDPSRWHTHIPTYEKVQFENVRPGVNLVYYGNQSQLEYDFVLSPGVRPESLSLSFEGSDATVDEQGDLVFTSTGGKITFRRPVAYQCYKPEPGSKHFLSASYVLKGHNRVGFDVPDYDPHEPLIIDPVLNYSTYLGGNGGDTGNAIALDTIYDAYVTGSTASTNFPTKTSVIATSPYQKTYGGDTDAFVTEVRYDGEAIIYSTYLGGNNFDVGNGIAVDSSGDAYITGTTYSANFPISSQNVFQPTLGGNSDAFVSKLDPSGSRLLYSSYLGGSNYDYGLGIALDQYGKAYLTGSTQSTDFPISVNAIQTGNAGNGDAFAAEVSLQSAGLADLVYSTYLGGGGADSGQGIAVDLSGAFYVVGYTFSTNFPTFNAYQPKNAGNVNAFITKFSPGGSTFAFSTYLGGTGDDRGWAVALDDQLNIYVTGSALQPTPCTLASTPPGTTLCNPSATFPTTPGAWQTYTVSQYPGYSDVFVTKLNYPGSALLYSTLLGGALTDSPAGIAVDGLYNAYVTGYTQSNNFPTANAVQASYTGGTCGPNPCPDAFITEVNPQGTALVYSTYLGGSLANWGNGIALDSSIPPNTYVVGTTTSSDFPAIALAYQGGPGNTTGLGNAFISKLEPADAPAVALTPQSLAFGNVAEYTTENLTALAQPATVTVMNPSTVPLQITSITTTGDFAETDNCVGTLPAGGGRCTINVTFTPTVLVAETEQLGIADNATGSPHLVLLTGTGITPVTTVQFTPPSLTFPGTKMNTTSAPQTVTVTNTSTSNIPLTITAIAVTGDFAETNNCPATPFSLPPAGYCSFYVTFTPTGTGTLTGNLTLTDNVGSGASSLALTGVGNPVFNLTSPTLQQNLNIGTTTTTFTITLLAPSSFTDAVTLSCTGGASCAFNPTTIAFGQPTLYPTTSTLTLTGLSASTTNPYNFTVSGNDITTLIGTATLNLTIYLADFSLSASPAINTVQSGGSAYYTITVGPINGFSQPVALSCPSSALPQGVSCLPTPSSVNPNGAAVTSSVLISTTAQSTTTSGLLPSARPRIPPGPRMMLILWGTSNLMILIALLLRRKMGCRGTGRRKGLIYAKVALATLVLATAFWMSCDTSIYTNVIQPNSVNGTPTGNYHITVEGSFTGTTSNINGIPGAPTVVNHATSVNLTVL
jgi:hypothetical protein